MKSLIWLMLICLLLSCGSSPVMRQVLEHAESCMEEYPDSALSLLQQQKVEDCNNEEQKAHYNLLLTQALDKATCSIDDAPIASALAFYAHSNDSLKKAKAFYYQGRQYEDRKEYEASAQCLLRALTALKPLDVPKYEALCYAHLGHVNSEQALYQKSLVYFKKAASLFDEAKDSMNYMITLLDVGYNFLFLAQCDSAEFYTHKGAHWAKLIGDNEELQVAVRNLGIIYSRQKEYRKALETLLSVKHKIENDDYSYYSSLVDVYIRLKQYDTAEYYIENIVKLDNDIYGQATAYLYLYTIAKERQNWEQALTYREQYDLLADSIKQQLQSEKLEDIQEKYDNQALVHDKESLAMRKQHSEWVLGSTILIVVFLLLFVISLYKKEKNRKEQHILHLQHQIQTNENTLMKLQHSYIQRNKEIEKLSLQYETDNKTLSAESERNKQRLLELQRQDKEENLKLADENLALLNRLRKYQEIKAESGRYYETIIFVIGLLNNPDSAKALMADELDAIESLVIRLFGPMFQSRVEAVGLSATERKLWCLLQLGFSHATIATFLNITPQSVSKAKFRMKKKIQEFVGEDVEKLYI